MSRYRFFGSTGCGIDRSVECGVVGGGVEANGLRIPHSEFRT